MQQTGLPKTRVVVLGIMGRTPYAGVAWQVLHYLEGFRRLGYEVYYIEDTGDWPYDVEQNSVTDDSSFTVRYIGDLMHRYGFDDHWAYRSGVTGEPYGLSEFQISKLLKETAVLVNLTGATVLREEHLRVPYRIYLETDPVMPQIEVAEGRQFTIDLLDAHTHHFTYGENLGAPDCGVPMGRYMYFPTRQPIVLDWWRDAAAVSTASNAAAPFTTIANWQQSGKDIEWNGQTYFWSKHLEFLKFIDLPEDVEQPLELALACGDDHAVALLRSHGWRVRDAMTISKNIATYRDYIQASRGEFTVAKDQNVRLRSGWFSDRSACYLAAGKPVITQDTGFGALLPTGIGLFKFRTCEDIVEAFDSVASNYSRNSQAALEVAQSYFKAESVLETMMSVIGAQKRVEST